MLVGHLAVGLLTKRITPKVSFGTLVLASLVPDLFWCFFLLLGIEEVHLNPSRGAANFLADADIAFSHSLLMDTVWAALFGGAYQWLRRDAPGALAVAAIVLSHWLLDAISNRDMPLAPGLEAAVGLRLWSSIPGTLILEGGLWVVALAVYVRAARSKGRTGFFVFWIAVALLTLAWFNNIAGNPPPDVRTMAASSLIFFSIVVAWAYWVNRLRRIERDEIAESAEE